MLALFAGTGALPPAIIASLQRQGQSFVVCEMEGFPVEHLDSVTPIRYRLESLGSLLLTLKDREVQTICFAGAIRRPQIDPAMIDSQTIPLVPLLLDAMKQGDDGALRAVIDLFENQGFKIRGAHEFVPDLLPQAGMLTGPEPDRQTRADLMAAIARHGQMSVGDIGQAVVAENGEVIASEGPDGTDAMLQSIALNEPTQTASAFGDFLESAVDSLLETFGAPHLGPDGDHARLLYKAPKTMQDRRVDLPVIGPQTVFNAAQAGITTIVIEAGGVMVLDRDKVQSMAEVLGMRIWVREASA